MHLAGTSFPVGKVEIIHMYPMSFGEFLQAASMPLFNTYTDALVTPKSVSSIAHERLWRFFKDYLTTGGLPEVVSVWLEGGAHHGGLRAFEAARAQ